MASLLRATNLWGFDDLVRELEGDPRLLRKRFGIQAGVEDQDDAFVDFGSFVQLLEATAAELACPDLGLRLAQWQGLDILGPLAVIARNAQTVAGGWDAIARYLYVHSPALRLTIAPRVGTADLVFTYELTDSDPREVSQGYELSLANAVRIIRMLAGPEAHPVSMSFMHQQLGSDAAYAQALGCPVLFGQPQCGFDIPAATADRLIDNADAETRRIATRYLESHYPPDSASLSDRVSQLAAHLLPTGQCSVDAIAAQLATHPRTLQRQLALEGTTVQAVIERVRRGQAANYLAEPRLALHHIAALLGYAEQSTLNHACRRWFGKTPRQFRAELTGSRPGL